MEPDLQPSPGHAPLRVWPALLLAGLIGAIKLFVDPAEGSMATILTWIFGPVLCCAGVLVWWGAASRATPRERVVGAVGVALIGLLTTLLADPSVLGIGTLSQALPWGGAAFVVALALLRGASPALRTGVALLAAGAAFGYWDLVRMDELRGDFSAEYSWRWTPTAEERLLASLADRPEAPAAGERAEELLLGEPDWPGFRGPGRNGAAPGVTLAEDWEASPPREVWRVRVGPGWSSFAVAGSRLFTQEQRGEQELVVCYDAANGAELWTHQTEARFWEAMGGAGPRATPTLADGALYSLGATGRLLRLDPFTGEEAWGRDLGADADRAPPTWGYSSSPLVVGGLVVVHAGGAGEKGLLAYDAATGEPHWSAPAEAADPYTSPQLSLVAGRPCLLLLTQAGLFAFDPESGDPLGGHDWPFMGYRVPQPMMVGESSVLIATSRGVGTRRLDLAWDDDGRLATSLDWESRGMSPDFNDAVLHDGFVYGFDATIFACLDAATGERKWKRGRYGAGQALLLPDGDQLLVLSEEGELVLLRPSPDRLTELARHPVLSGRTWNHPVLVGDRLYVRNSEEAACFAMPLPPSPKRPRANSPSDG